MSEQWESEGFVFEHECFVQITAVVPKFHLSILTHSTFEWEVNILNVDFKTLCL